MTWPLGAHKDAFESWLDTKRIGTEKYKQIWRKFEGDTPLFDDNVAQYSEWKDDTNTIRKGMRNSSNKKHGIYRAVFENDDIAEVCMKDDFHHGLKLVWRKNREF